MYLYYAMTKDHDMVIGTLGELNERDDLRTTPKEYVTEIYETLTEEEYY